MEQVKKALVLTATVLAVVYIGRQVSITAPIINTALRG